MSRTSTDILYIELDYYDPENYYVYTANAAMLAEGYMDEEYFVGGYFETEGMEFLLSCSAEIVQGVTHQGEANLTATATLSATALKQLSGEADLNTSATLSAQALTVVGAAADLASSAQVSVSVQRIRSAEISVSAQFTQSATAERTRIDSASLSSSTSLSATGARTRGFGAGLNASASITCSNFRIRPLSADFGALFTPSITCRAILVGEIPLLAQFTQSTTGVKTAAGAAAFTSSATQSTIAAKTGVSGAQFNSTATVSATPINAQITSSDLSTSTALVAEGWITNKRPRQYQLFDSPEFILSQSGFDKAIQVGNYYSNSTDPYLQWYASEDWKTWRTMDFFVKPVLGFAGTGQSAQIYGQSENFRFVTVRLYGGTQFSIEIVTRQGPDGNLQNYTYRTSGFTSTNYTHVRIVRHSGGLDVWIDGTLDTPATDTSSPDLPDISAGPVLGDPDYDPTFNALLGIDEFWLSSEQVTAAGTASITVPDKPRYLNASEQTNTIVLTHMEDDVVDDLEEATLGSASVTANATLSATPLKQLSAECDLASSASITTVATKIVRSSADLNTSATLTATLLLTKRVTVTLNSEAQFAGTVGAIRNFDCDLASSTTFTCDARVVSTGDIDLNSQFALNVTATRIRNAECDAGALFTPQIDADITARPPVYLESQFDLDATVSKIARTSADLASSATVSATAGKIVDGTTTLSSSATISAEGDIIKKVTVALSSTATLTANTQFSKTGTLTSDLASQSVFSVDVVRGRLVDCDLLSTAGCFPTGIITKQFDSSMESAFTQAVIAGSVLRTSAAFTAFNSVLAAGKVLNFDAFRTLIVDQETRTLEVLPENRTIIVAQETRLNTLL